MSEFVNRVVVVVVADAVVIVAVVGVVGAAVVAVIDVSHACREDNTTRISRVCQSNTPTFGGRKPLRLLSM